MCKERIPSAVDLRDVQIERVHTLRLKLDLMNFD